MTIKTVFGLLVGEVLICFAPITLLWGFGVLMFGAVVFDGWGLGIWMMPAFILLFLGGLGLIGLFQIMVHIYHIDFVEAETAVYRKLYAGILSMAILSIGTMIGNGFSVELIVFLLPVFCSLHLIYLTKSKRGITRISLDGLAQN
jgi:hypothetical protein